MNNSDCGTPWRRGQYVPVQRSRGSSNPPGNNRKEQGAITRARNVLSLLRGAALEQ